MTDTMFPVGESKEPTDMDPTTENQLEIVLDPSFTSRTVYE